MIAEWIFYFFLIPWIILIATIPGLAMHFLFTGVAVQLLGYIMPSAIHGKAVEE